jgi:hypothetical protein
MTDWKKIKKNPKQTWEILNELTGKIIRIRKLAK